MIWTEIKEFGYKGYQNIGYFRPRMLTGDLDRDT